MIFFDLRFLMPLKTYLHQTWCTGFHMGSMKSWCQRSIGSRRYLNTNRYTQPHSLFSIMVCIVCRGRGHMMEIRRCVTLRIISLTLCLVFPPKPVLFSIFCWSEKWETVESIQTRTNCLLFVFRRKPDSLVSTLNIKRLSASSPEDAMDVDAIDDLRSSHRSPCRFYLQDIPTRKVWQHGWWRYRYCNRSLSI